MIEYVLSRLSDAVVQPVEAKLGKIRGGAFEFEQFGFGLESARKAGQLAGGTDHAMAGHDDRKGIFAIGQTHRP